MVAPQPKELTWRDALQNANTIRFGELGKTVDCPPTFTFTPPKGADVLRQGSLQQLSVKSHLTDQLSAMNSTNSDFADFGSQVAWMRRLPLS